MDSTSEGGDGRRLVRIRMEADSARPNGRASQGGAAVVPATRRSGGRRGSGGIRGPRRPCPIGQPELLAEPLPAGERQGIRGDPAHENAHVAYLIKAITDAGGTARPKPSFVDLNQANLVAFAQTSQALENTGLRRVSRRCPVYLRRCLRLRGRLDPGHRGEARGLPQRAARSAHDVQHRETVAGLRDAADCGPGRHHRRAVLHVAQWRPCALMYSTTDLGPANDIMILNFALRWSTSSRPSTTSTSPDSPEPASLIEESYSCQIDDDSGAGSRRSSPPS